MIIIILLVLLLPDLYIWYHFVRGAHWALQVLYWLPLVVSITLMTLVQTPYYQAWMFRVAMSTVLIFSLPKLLFMLCSLIGWGGKFIVPMSWKVMNGVGVTVSAAALCIVAYGIFLGWKRLDVHEVTLEFSDLPKGFDGYRIVQLSDLHVGTYADAPECVERIVDQVNEINADMICFTGDLVNSSSEELDPFMSIFPKMKAKDGIYSIMGNHDYCMYRHYTSEAEHRNVIHDLQQRERSFGWDLLLNENRIIHHNGDSIMLAGVENSSKPPFPDYGDLKKALSPLPASPGGGEDLNTLANRYSKEQSETSTDKHSKGQITSNISSPRGGREGAVGAVVPFTILLSHDPTHWQRKVLSETDVQLQLSGHTHATQFKLFGWSPATFAYKEWGGLYEMLTNGNETINPDKQNPTSRKLYISTGTGGNLAFRFGVYPEIVVITLKGDG